MEKDSLEFLKKIGEICLGFLKTFYSLSFVPLDFVDLNHSMMKEAISSCLGEF